MEKENGKTGTATPAAATPLALSKRDFVDVVAAKVKGFLDNGELFLPKNYSPDNALKAAWLQLQSVVDKDNKLALMHCTRDSIANALLDMIVMGLNPMKKQCYFLVYGNKLTCQKSYFGAMAISQMVEPRIGEFTYGVVYQDDVFKYGIKNGKKLVTEHTQDIKNVDKSKIVAAYCMVFDKAGEIFKTEIMTFAEIKQSWKQSKQNPIDENGNIKPSSVHGKFTADMSIRTVINKACKIIVNASSDNALLLERMNRAGDLADAAAVQEEIADKANTGEVLEIGGPADIEIKDEGQAPPIDGQPEGEGVHEPTEADMQKQVNEAAKRGPKF